MEKMSKLPPYQLKKTDDLIPYVNNSRTHSEPQVNQIASSIKEFGFTNPVLIDEDGGIIAGHGRLMAARKLGIDVVPTITLVDLTEAQKKAYVIADNKLALNSGWDYEALRIEVEQLTDFDFDIGLLGFGEIELESILNEEIDLSILDEVDDEIVDGMESGVKKAIMVEFEAEHYEDARDLFSWWRAQNSYIGYMLLSYLRSEKDKHENS